MAGTLLFVDPQQGRWTAELDGDFVVFLIGAKVHDPAAATEASGLLMAMTEMLDELEADPAKGLLGYTRHGEPGHGVIVQYWRSFDALESYARNPDFIQTYIFPGGMLLDEPSFEALASERSLSWQDREGFRFDYAETLKRWRERYDQAVERHALNGFAEPFHQLWRYYLMYCEGGFRGGAIDVAQITMVKS